VTRDEGDGSSSSTNADDPGYPHSRNANREIDDGRRGITVQVAEYVRNLENRLALMERDRYSLVQRLLQLGVHEQECLPSPASTDVSIVTRFSFVYHSFFCS